MIKITSPSFLNEGKIPADFTCNGSNINPALNFDNVPAEAKSLVLIVDDTDASAGVWTHWLVFNIDPTTRSISQNSQPTGSVNGLNDSGNTKYDGPCPPSGNHRYYFRIFALATVLSLTSGTRRWEVEQAMADHIIDSGEMYGTYENLN